MKFTWTAKGSPFGRAAERSEAERASRLSNREYQKESTIMGMTLTQKILAAHAGLAEVKAGQLINA